MIKKIPGIKIKPGFWFGLLAVSAVFLNGTARAEDIIDPRIVNSQNAFALKAFGKLVSEEPAANTAFAPLSAGSLLRMAYLAANGAAQNELAAMLEMPGFSLEEIQNGSMALWTLSQKPDKEVDYGTHALLWGSRIHFDLEYMRKVSIYGVIPYSFDFQDPRAPSMINNWFQASTRNRMATMTDFFDMQMPTAFFNAVYFKGNWQTPFDVSRTRKDVFKVTGENEKTPLIMSTSGVFEFYKEDQFQAVNLPYGDARFSMYIFLPEESIRLQDFLSSLTLEKMNAWIGAFLERPGEVRLPKFKVEQKIDLRKLFKLLGMKASFDPEQADFKKGFVADVKHKGYLGSMTQKTWVEVDEHGIMNPPSPTPEIDASAGKERFSVSVNRPFFFIIRDNQIGTYIMMGTVYDPKSGMTAAASA